MYAMNWFRIAADILHLVSFLILLFKIRSQRSCAGVSLKTQILFLIVFVCRYLDLPWNIYFVSFFHWYLAAMKIIYIGSTALIIYYIHTKYRGSYNQDEDGLPLYFVIPPCIILALIWNQDFTFFEVMWAFSIYLEAVAILPQLLMLQATGNVETMTSHYIFCLGGYRALYLVNWIYRYTMEEGFSQWIVWISGFIQTLLYIDFFYYYIKGMMKGDSVKLPTSTAG